ncbi:FxDxF family PEP-CTERM protein [uncultured Rhodoferax sp.]|uniref:FxDxF family PEP-CTERM protein n=1 Tax=uncultured Rhodoferax sp. TaxID=223188 RepID=UPI0025FF598A|nr:FxDxF family PEP-CTERM protein [uncultured Rhodoferax sp.]
MKKLIATSVLAFSAVTGAQAASTSLSFNEVSGGGFLETFVVTPDAANKLTLRVSGMATQFSSLALSLWDGATNVVSASSTNLNGNVFSVFNDRTNTAISLIGGKTYTLKITGTAVASGNVSVGTLVVNNGTVSPVPEPESYALLLAGLGLIGTVAKRRIRKTVA